MRAPDDLSLESIISSVLNDHLGYVLKWTAGKPGPYIVKSFDVGQPTDYNSDYSWHSLKKERLFDLPKQAQFEITME